MKPPAAASLVHVETAGAVARVALNRPAKRNALSDALLLELDATLRQLPESIKAVVLHGAGEHFCAGLDLSELRDLSAADGMFHSHLWHDAFNRIQFGRVPVIAVLQGAVVGGGLELACAAHIRVAEPSTFYALPEGSRGIFVGGGGSVRIPKLIGVPRVTDMMLTGRVYDAQEGHQAGFAQYLVGAGQGLAHAQALAEKVAGNSALSNFSIMHALPRIAAQNQSDGLFMEAMIAGITQADQDAKDRMRAFLDHGANKVRKPKG